LECSPDAPRHRFKFDEFNHLYFAFHFSRSHALAWECRPNAPASLVQILRVQQFVFISSFQRGNNNFSSKSNQLEIITRDAGASGRHSNAAHWNEELFVLFDKNLP
jgi:hypothetical protein